MQDLRIADFAETEGRAVVVAVNKWDLEDDKQEKLAELKEMFERLLPQLRGAPLVTVSAKTGRGLDRLHDAIRKAHDVWNRRIPTAKLNSWLGAMTEAHRRRPGGHRIKLRYMTQAKTRPPGFMIKCSRPDELPESYKRYLVNGLRDHFDMPARRSVCSCGHRVTRTPGRNASSTRPRGCASTRKRTPAVAGRKSFRKLLQIPSKEFGPPLPAPPHPTRRCQNQRADPKRRPGHIGPAAPVRHRDTGQGPDHSQRIDRHPRFRDCTSGVRISTTPSMP